jgi:hypothetical protein
MSIKRTGMSSIRLKCAAILAIGGSSGSLRAGVIGDVLHVTYNYNNVGTISKDFGTFTVTGTESLVNAFNDETLSFSSDHITLTNTTPGQFNVNQFDGYVINLVSGPAFLNVTKDASSSTFLAGGSVLNFSASQISLSIAGTCGGCVGGEKIVLDVTSTPEPSSLVLLGSALLLGVASRLKRKERVHFRTTLQ